MPVTDALVTRALAAFESLPPHSGLFERMRAALEAVTKPSERAERPAGGRTRRDGYPGKGDAAQRGSGRLSAP